MKSNTAGRIMGVMHRVGELADDGIPGSQPQKGVASYALSANRQRPLAGTLNAAIFNTWRRFRGQVLYVAPPFIIAYTAMEWAIERFVLSLLIRPTLCSNSFWQKRILEL